MDWQRVHQMLTVGVKTALGPDSKGPSGGIRQRLAQPSLHDENEESFVGRKLCPGVRWSLVREPPRRLAPVLSHTLGPRGSFHGIGGLVAPPQNATA